jgi:glucose/arabinose dehydrogenase
MSRKVVAILAGTLVVIVGAGVAVAWYFGLLFTDPTGQGPPVDVPAGAVRTIATDLEAPWGLAFLPNGDALVTERDSGRLLSVDPDGGVREVQRIAEASPGGEGGLLGVAISPDFATDQLVYVYYTAEADNRVARMKLGEPPQVIFSGIPRGGRHNGGRIAFGPDGLLYVGTGDASDDPIAQDRTSLAGKILRLTPDGQPAPDNPFAGSPVYSYGHRNVQGLAWDDEGVLYAAEFGQNRYDELNRIQAGGNYGWPEVEGMGDDAAYVNPIATWSTSDASPSGIAVLDGYVYIACLRGTKLYRIRTDGQDARALLADQFGRLRHAAVAPDGSLWILTSNRDGRGDPTDGDDRILRLDPARL